MSLLVSCGVFHPRQGGAESLFFDLAGALAGRGHDVTVLTRRFDDMPEEETVPVDGTDSGFHIVRFDWPVPYEDLRLDRDFVLRSPAALWRTLRLLRSRNVTTVCIGLLDMSVLYLLAARALHGFRLVTYLHGAEIRDLPRDSPAFDKLVRRCIATSDAVVAVSPSLAAHAARAYPAAAHKLTVIPNGIDFESFAAAPASARERPYLLFVGRLAGEKNVALILRAFARAASTLADVDLLVAGAGPEDAALEALAESLGIAERAVFLGPVERASVFALVKGSLFLVLASNAESHPIVALEAFAAGKTVIAPRVVGVTDMIEDGVNGALFPPGDVDALSKLMVRYARDGAARAALEANVGRIDPARYDIEALAGEHLRVLDPRP